MGSDFIQKVNEAIASNLSDEQFGVSELAEEVGMSRSNLLRRIKSETGKSASQYIRTLRLEEAMVLLKQRQHNVSEVSFKVGFGSTSYFIKCFREHYGYPPGEVHNRPEAPDQKVISTRKMINPVFIGAMVLIVAIVALTLWSLKTSEKTELEKSIAVLPFKNDSNDSTNLYLINGLMESTLNNLQKLKNLRVVSRTSVERYRETNMTVPEIARELPVSFLVEGSGQKVGKRIKLNIQLIEAATDRHLWAKQYEREVDDIFELQREIAKNIASEIQVIITPEEEARINRTPTTNLEAYDQYLKGVNFLNKETKEGLTQSIPYFEKALELDQEFGLAYAHLAIAYYFLDIYQVDKKYADNMKFYADKSLLYAPDAPESLIAKAYYYMQIKEYERAIPYLERALEYVPNSGEIINTLSDFYTNYVPNTKKYLEYALKGVRLSANVKDSVTNSYLYLHLSNALIQNGFVKEANHYIDVSLAYNPDNFYSGYVRAFLKCAENKDLDQTVRLLLAELSKDTSRIDITQEVAKVYYYQGKYEEAAKYYKKLIRLRERLGVDIYRHEHLKIGDTFNRLGIPGGDWYVEDFREFAKNDHSMYRDLSLTAYYAYKGENDLALDHFEKFSGETDFQYWILLFIEDDPVMEKLLYTDRFQTALGKLRTSFWSNHERLKEKLMEEDLI